MLHLQKKKVINFFSYLYLFIRRCEVVNINAEDALEIDTFNDIELAKCLLQKN